MSSAFHELTIGEVRRETPDAVSVRFDLPAALREVFAFRPGQHLTLRHRFDGEDVRRNYSICAAPSDGELRIAIKRIEGGVFSTWATHALKAGEIVEVMAPHGAFTWSFDPRRTAHYVGFAGGSGVTPIISLLKTMLVEEPHSHFTLIYGNRDSNSIIFLEELASMKNKFMDRLELYHVLAEEEGDVDLFNGRLDSAKIVDLFATLFDPSDVGAAFICGPGPMMDAVEQALLQRGVIKDRILVERFTADGPSQTEVSLHQDIDRRAEGRAVVVTLDGRRRTILFDSAKGGILENARAAGMAAPFACKAGVCATCRAKLVSGEVHMKANYGLSAEEVAQGYILTCQSSPLSDNVAVDFDA